MVTTCPGPALRSSLYTLLIRDSLQPLPIRATGETKYRARDGEGVQSTGMKRMALNSTPPETFNHRRGTP